MEKCFLVLLLIPYAYSLFDGTLEDRFEYYEKLETTAVVHHIDKRAADLDGIHEKLVSVDALGNHFRLRLHTIQGLFSPEFQTVAVNSANEEEEVFVDRREFYTGYVEDFPGSKVNAHWQDNVLVAVIHTKADTFVVEPSWRHIKDSDKYPMIAYRFSDLKRRVENDFGDHFCGLVDQDGTDYASFDILRPLGIKDFDDKLDTKKTETPEETKTRFKRQNSKLTRCPVALVADYRTYVNIGKRNIGTTVKFLVSVLAEVNNIFLEAKFGDGLEYGMEIKRVVVHSAPTDENGHYNLDNHNYGTNELLTAFSSTAWDDVCLAHLFTYTSFSNGVLGLAWIASEKPGDVGGICTFKSGGKYYNTGWSTSLNAGGNRLTTVEAYLVTTHEFGHNWGSPHDPETKSCSPDKSDGGKYLMYTYSVTGSDDNNVKFSKCSRNTVQNVLNARKDLCFTRQGETNFCGNYEVEGNEECDPGFDPDNDPCCDQNCFLRQGKTCSDVNHPCCDQCDYAPATTVCNGLADVPGSCYNDVVCTGSSEYCPDPTDFKPLGTECSVSGQCDGAGTCETACELNGETDCTCDNENDACKMCCRNSDGRCRPYEDNGEVNLADGTPCFQGYCDNGECKSEIRDLTRRLWDILDDVKSFSGFIKFMRNNIVLSVVVLSLILYMPFVIFILCADYRKDKDDDDEVDWHHKDNDNLFSPKDRRDVRETYTRSRKSRGGYANRGYDEDESLVGPSSRASAAGVNFDDEY